MNLHLTRFYKNSNQILGLLRFSEKPDTFLYTLEPIVKKALGCIPEGVFEYCPYASPRFGQTINITVPERSGILVHAGNTFLDTHGCILVGLKQSMEAVSDSRKAMTLFRSIVGKSSGTITVSSF